MPYFTDTELGKSLRANQLFPVYFLYGKEIYLSAGYLQKLVEKAVPKGTESFNLQKFDGQNPDMVSLQVALEGMPLMAGRKCVVFVNPNLEKMKKEDFESLLELVKDPNPTSIFILYVNAFDLNPKKMSRVKKIGDAVAKNGVVVDFSPLTQGDLVKFLKARVQKAGLILENPAASAIIQRCGSDLSTLSAEADKLIAYKGESPGAEITREDVELVTRKSLEASIFDLSKQMLRKDSTGSFRILEDLFALREEPLAILGALNGAFLDLYRAKSAQLSSKTEEDIAALYPSYRGKEFRIRNAFRDAGKTSVTTLRECIFILSQADVQLKSQRCDAKAVVEQTVAALLHQIAGGR